VTAVQRRETELSVLESEGVRVVHLSRWHCRMGSVHLWLATGRWMNEATSACGKINYIPLRQLLDSLRSLTSDN
jgi:hypothetical protein